MTTSTADEAISGATDDRAGLRRLLQAALQKQRPFDVILVDDTSRMSRDLADSLKIVKKMKFAGVRMVFVSQGFDTSAPQMQTLVTVHGLVDSLYLEELGKKTYRGVEHRALNGLHTGGRVFGYRPKPIESQTQRDSYGRAVIQGVRLEVDSAQAATIRRIFERYAKGDSLKRIAMDLNKEAIASPQPQKGRISQSSPQRAIPWRSPYLFSGLLKCSLCGASITMVSGCSRKRQDVRYGCSMHYNRGHGACSNTLLIARCALEEQLLTGLQERVLHPDVIGYTLDAFEQQFLLGENGRADQSALLRRRLETIGKQIRNCTDAIAEGNRYSSLMEKLSVLEQELADTKAKIAYSDPRAARPRLRDTRQFVETQLAHLQSLLTGEPRIARTEIAKHVEKITLTPEGRVYVASGTWNLLGAGAWQHGWCRGPG
jgi:DNA invertase Pin-like site-specific DNA recombinase